MWSDRPRTDFGALRAIRCGSGPRLLLLHGVGLRAEAWNAQIDALSADFDIVAPDMPGHGETPPLPDAATLAAYTAPILDALEGPTWVAGHSMGAMMALDLAVRAPSRVRGVAALNAIYRRSPEASAAVRARAEALDPGASADPQPTLARWFGRTRSAASGACLRWLTAVDPAGYRDAYRVFAAEDGPEAGALAALGCPALFCTGADEPNSTPAMSEAMADLAPAGRVLIVPGAAHMMPMTHPDAVTAALRDFLHGASA